IGCINGPRQGCAVVLYIRQYRSRREHTAGQGSAGQSTIQGCGYTSEGHHLARRCHHAPTGSSGPLSAPHQSPAAPKTATSTPSPSSNHNHPSCPISILYTATHNCPKPPQPNPAITSHGLDQQILRASLTSPSHAYHPDSTPALQP